MGCFKSENMHVSVLYCSNVECDKVVCKIAHRGHQCGKSKLRVNCTSAAVSPTKNSWMLHPLDKVSLDYFAPDRTIPNFYEHGLELNLATTTGLNNSVVKI